jgi:hypothetical protein
MLFQFKWKDRKIGGFVERQKKKKKYSVERQNN